MINPKDAFGTPLNQGDSVELIHDVKFKAAIIPKGNRLNKLYYSESNDHAEFHEVQIGDQLVEIVAIPTKDLKKI